MENQLTKETNDRVDLAQYGRRNMVEVAGIPHTNDENATRLITKMAAIAKFEKFDPAQIEVAHRVSVKPTAAIIIKFLHRQDRENFYYQRSKLQTIHVRQFESEDELHKYATAEEQKDRSPNTKIYLNESLTPRKTKALGRCSCKSKRYLCD